MLTQARRGAPAPLPPAIAARLAAGFADLSVLAGWAYRLSPPREIEVVVQDEYTHDVLVPLAPRLCLVFDCT